MSVSVFVIMQVCKLGAKIARLFHSDSVEAFFKISIPFDSSQCRSSFRMIFLQGRLQ